MEKKNMLRKIGVMLLTVLMILSLTGCGEKEEPEENEEEKYDLGIDFEQFPGTSQATQTFDNYQDAYKAAIMSLLKYYEKEEFVSGYIFTENGTDIPTVAIGIEEQFKAKPQYLLNYKDGVLYITNLSANKDYDVDFSFVKGSFMTVTEYCVIEESAVLAYQQIYDYESGSYASMDQYHGEFDITENSDLENCLARAKECLALNLEIEEIETDSMIHFSQKAVGSEVKNYLTENLKIELN